MNYKNKLPSDKKVLNSFNNYFGDAYTRMNLLVEFKEKMERLHITYRELSEDLAIQTFNSSNNVSDEISKEIDKIDGTLNQNFNSRAKGDKLQYKGEHVEKKQLEKLIQEYERKSLKEVKQKLNQKVKKLIEISIKTKADERISYVESQRDSIRNKITGRNKLKEARINNITTRLNYEIEKNRASNPQNKIRGILADMYKCADKYYDGILTPEMQEIENAIRRNFKLGKRELPTRAELTEREKTNSLNLPIVKKKSPRIFKWFYEKKEIESLDIDTHKLNSATQNIKNTQPNKFNKVENTIETSYSRIMRTLKKIKDIVLAEKIETNEF